MHECRGKLFENYWKWLNWATKALILHAAVLKILAISLGCFTTFRRYLSLLFYCQKSSREENLRFRDFLPNPEIWFPQISTFFANCKIPFRELINFFDQPQNLFPWDFNFESLEISLQWLIFVTQMTIWHVFSPEYGGNVEIVGLKVWFLLKIIERQWHCLSLLFVKVLGDSYVRKLHFWHLLCCFMA